MRSIVSAVALLGVVAFTGCAGYRIQENGAGPGYDVYAPEPYLKGEPYAIDTAGGKVVAYKFEVVWLPNYGKRYRVHSWAGLGKADFTFKFDNGWKLTDVSDKSDNEKVLSGIVDLAKHLLPSDPFSIAKSLTPPPGPAPTLPMRPVLYRIDFDADGRPACLKELSIQTLPCPGPGPCR